MKMKYNLKESKCACGQDLTKEITDFLDSEETIYCNFRYDVWDWGFIRCPNCKKVFSIETGKMEVDVYIHEEDEEEYA